MEGSSTGMGGGDIIGGIMLGMMNNALAAKRESIARGENYKYNEMAAENADKRTRALYKDLMSPEALLQQYKNAGLSPSLMFGGGGVGGQVSQGAQGAGVTGIQPTAFGIDASQIAQIEVAHAQARKLNADADRMEGKNKLGAAEIKKIMAETTNVELHNTYQAIQNTLSEWEETIRGANLQEEIEARKFNFKKAKVEYDEYLQALRSATVKGDIDEATRDASIKYIQDQVNLQLAQITLARTEKQLKEHQITLTDNMAKKLIADVQLYATELQLKGESVKLDAAKLKEIVKQWAVQNDLTRRGQNIEIADIIVDAVGNLLETAADFATSGGLGAIKKQAKIGFSAIK